MGVDEALNFLEAGDDSFFARRAAGSFRVLDLDAEFGEKGVVLVREFFRHRRLAAFIRARKATPSAMRFSQGSGDVIDGSRPRSCLNFKARLARSRASSGVSWTFLAEMTAATCFRLCSLMVLARMA